MHPEDFERRILDERVKQLEEDIKKDELNIDKGVAQMNELYDNLRNQVPQEHHYLLDALNTFMSLFEQIGRNRVKIHELLTIIMLNDKLHSEQIQFLSNKVAGLDKNR